MRRGPGRATDAQGWVPPTAGLGLKARMTGSARTNGNAEQASSAPLGGSACVIHSLCCPVGGRPASPRKSHSKSQRGQTSGDTQLRQATVEAGQVPGEPSPATSSDTREVTGGQGVAGSNPAVPTGR